MKHIVKSKQESYLLLGNKFLPIYSHKCSCGEEWVGGKFSLECPKEEIEKKKADR